MFTGNVSPARVYFRLAILVVLFTGLTGTSFSVPAAQKMQLILHPSVQPQTLSHTEARMVFSARKQHWDDGTKIKVFVLKTDSMLHQYFCRQILRMFPYQLERIWNQITYSGQGDSPEIVDSQEALIDAVYSTPGAVGYATEEKIEQVRAMKDNS